LVLGGTIASACGVSLSVWLYRRLQRHLHPIVAVQRNLCAYASGLENQLAALGLSDTLGQVGRAWNQLIARGAELQLPWERTSSTDRGNVLQRFESRSLRQVLDRLPLGVIRYAAGETISYANAAAVRLLGRRDAGLVGAALSDAIGDESTLKQIRSIVES